MEGFGSRSTWVFRHARFDSDEGRLTVGGKAVELDRGSRAILALLAQNAGEIVTKERLLEVGWPNRIVHENSLAKAIGRLRLALGPAAAALTTVYGYGYRLEVEDGAKAPDSDQVMPAIPFGAQGAEGREPSPDSARTRWLGILALGIVTVGLATFLWTGSRSASELQFREEAPVTGDAPDAIGRVLWVDDNPPNNVYEKQYFEDHRIAVHNVTNSTDAMRLLAMYDYTVVISDMGRGEDRLAGVRLVERMRREEDATPVVIYTIRADGAEGQQAQRDLVSEAGADVLAVTPEEVREVILRYFDNPPPRG